MLDAALANEGDATASIRSLTKQFSFPPQRPIKEAPDQVRAAFQARYRSGY
jgi:hypothetical protein